jgi:EAL domain-containing protein (putative c-di-GMP-specific phosphodiesterase class I)
METLKLSSKDLCLGGYKNVAHKDGHIIMSYTIWSAELQDTLVVTRKYCAQRNDELNDGDLDYLTVEKSDGTLIYKGGDKYSGNEQHDDAIKEEFNRFYAVGCYMRLMELLPILEKWKKEGRPLYPISINLSRARLYQPDLTQHLTEIVDTYGVEHSLIDFELTESAAYDNRERMINVMSELKSKGFGISMDDFGTGYSSLSYLHSLPANLLKIDKSFIDEMNTEESNKQYVQSIISIGHVMGLEVISEGVENEDQLDTLKEIGCDYIQGFLWGRPMPAEDAKKLI